MVTNGSTLDLELIKELQKIQFKSITFSLDTIDKTKFAEIVGVDCLDRVLQNILDMKKCGINVKVNCALSKYNYNNIIELIDFCNYNEVPLKILDLVSMDSNYWREEWIPITGIKEYLENIAKNIEVQY